MADTFDVIVVGASAAGCAAAYTCASAGLRTVVLERQSVPGEGNPVGGLLAIDTVAAHAPALDLTGAPIERPIDDRRVMLCGATHHTTVATRGSGEGASSGYAAVRFDRFEAWLAERASKAGAEVRTGIEVTAAITDDNDQVCGVRTSDGRTLSAPFVIVADSTESPVLESLGALPAVSEWQRTAVAAELLRLPSGAINERFGVGNDCGTIVEFVGTVLDGVLGHAWLITGTDSVSLGVSGAAVDFRDAGSTPVEALQRVKANPTVAAWLAGSEPETGGTMALPDPALVDGPRLAGDGYVVCGRAAHFVANLARDGLGAALISGACAGAAAQACHAVGRFDRKFSAAYERRLEATPVLADLAKYRKTARLLRDHRGLLADYPGILAAFAGALGGAPSGSRKEHEAAAWEAFLADAGGLAAVLKDAFSAWRVFA